MPLFKVTMVFSLTTAVDDADAPLHRTGGWSESWYLTANSLADVIQRTTGIVGGAQAGLALRRAALLPVGASIVAQRYQPVNPTGLTQVLGQLIPASSGLLTDVPQMALLCAAPSLDYPNIKRFTLRGIPDARVVRGEYSPSAGFDAAITAFFNGLIGWQFRGRDLTAPTFEIDNISTGGVVTTTADHSFVAGNYVRVLRTLVTSSRNQVGILAAVTAPITARTFTLAQWPYGASTKGKVRLERIVYPVVDASNTRRGKIVVKKVGRPSSGYVGRRSA